ncbi:elongation factor P--(R)-beta-lysine ligase [Planctobacterium marinum]|uniref:elongation factor P--(R)-beta-lysine ligase n=1 Tax=Planctobacterium marinum TaxID=1631968 RepID=UPI001E3467BE|nr:elongation factor P--(R)-beta-lysine ligase [Planctobacterium marinum]MCC2607601.1 elongation factor P--(R)-beta-lysine ligase [Planctobacterium marinum]
MNWKPGADLATLQARAKLLADIRAFFAERKVLEVETPLMASAGVTDPHLVNFTTQLHQPGSQQARTLYLQTSPEYAMKRLLCAGSGCIYQICKAFRNEEQGRFHNPEFTMLEWYRVGFDHWQLMREMQDLLQPILACDEFEQLSYQQAFQHYLGFDPLSDSDEQLRELCIEQGYENFADSMTSRDTQLQLLFSHLIEPQIGQTSPCFIYHFPASQAALAQISGQDPRVAERFELYYKGIELANGFHELQSADEQEKRFAQDNQERLEMGIDAAKTDSHFLAALNSGLPDCAGVALGLDRLLMLIQAHSDIDNVLSFSHSRA